MKKINLFKFLDRVVYEYDQGCAYCCRRRVPLIALYVEKDLKSLESKRKVPQTHIALCPRCAAEYMNAYNLSSAKLNKNSADAFEWTEKQVLDSFFRVSSKKDHNDR